MTMGKLKATAAVAAASWMMASMVNAAVIDAEALTTVTVEAPLYDPSLGDANGCDPAGCVGDLTRVSNVGAQDIVHDCYGVSAAAVHVDQSSNVSSSHFPSRSSR